MSEQMTKQEAISEVRKAFKGNKRFISYCEIMIMSTLNFKEIESMDIHLDDWNWEKLLRLTINFGEYGFKNIVYRKGNKKYAPENTISGKGNTTSNIHDYSIFIYNRGEKEEFNWNA